MLPVTRTGNPNADMAAIMARVRKMSDSQLADILSGKDVSVPQFAAMTEAMGRRQLRQAVDGQQAMQQAQQPSVKDQLLAEQQAEMGGIAALPAPNMESVDMAGGGIIAFEQGGDVPRFQNTGLVDPSLYSFSPTSPVLPAYQEDPERKRIREINEEEDRIRAARKKAVADVFGGKGGAGDVRSGKAAQRAAEAPDFTEFDKDMALFEKDRANAPVTPAPSPAAPAASNVAPAVQPPAPSGKKEGIAKLADRVSYLDALQDVGKDIRGGIADIKNAKQSDILLGLSEALLTNPTLTQAAGKAAGKTAQIGAASRKEINELTKAANDYDFNLAKAREAAAQGNDELAYKYEALAEQAKYRAGILGIQGQKLGMMKDQYDMVKIPAQLSKVYADAKKEVDTAYNNMVPASKRAQYQKDVEDAYRKRAASVGLGKYIDTYSPSMGAYNVVQSPRKGAQTLELDEV